jgi:DNA-directed RNA polymerase subunit F
MIDTLKEARKVMRDTQDYLSDIIAYEWMQHHPHFHRNEKEHINKVVNNLIGTNNELAKLINKLKKEQENDNI